MLSMEKFNHVMLCAGTLYLITKYLLVREIVWENIFIAVLFLFKSFLSFLLTTHGDASMKKDLKYRPLCSSGLEFVLLVPLSALGNVITDDRRSLKLLWSSMSLSIVLMARFSSKVSLSPVLHGATLVVGCLLPLASSSFAVVMVTWLCNILALKAVDPILTALPKSFTFGELSVVLQLVFHWLCRLIFGMNQIQNLDEDSLRLIWFICTVIISACTATLVAYLSGFYKSLVGTVTVYLCHAIISLVFLHIHTQQQPVLWLVMFVCSSCSRVLLLVLCIVLLALALVWTAIQALSGGAQVYKSKTSYNDDKDINVYQLKETHGQLSDTYRAFNLMSGDTGETSKKLVQTIGLQGTCERINTNNSFETRKIFHIFILLVYVPGLLLDPAFLLLASSTAFGLFIVIEALRALQVPVVGKLLDDIQKTFVDDRDQGRVFLTHLYLLAGLSLPLWLSPHVLKAGRASLELYSGVLALGIGDTVACVVGRSFGKIRWPGTLKTVEGTAASVFAQLTFILVLYSNGFTKVESLTSASIGVVISAMVEAFTDQIDNLVLPLVLYPFLCL